MGREGARYRGERESDEGRERERINMTLNKHKKTSLYKGGERWTERN